MLHIYIYPDNVPMLVKKEGRREERIDMDLVMPIMH